MNERLVGVEAAPALMTLADLLVPATFGERGKGRSYTSSTPLNRLVDATRPESIAARDFGKQVEDIRKNKSAIRELLRKWGTASREILPVMKWSQLLVEAVPVAEDIGALAGSGLAALEYLDAGRHAPEAWLRSQASLLDRGAKMRADLRIMIVSAVQKLIEAAR